MISNIQRPEILAPCGSYEILIAAIKAGADACYIGGNRFSARAFADNLDDDLIVKAIDYAHLHGTRLYLTVNTLFKENELKELISFLKPYYEAGLDAVIVQDLGAFSLIKKHFPDLAIHCSTQMNINSYQGAMYMEAQGATRVVTAREMALSEISKIKETTNLEVETFVHGAMCYSFSGQCLLSSLAGGRSGNRGRCAQPCRKCYDNSYLLSMKDMCTLPNLPELIDTGIDSLKIEGRMKNAYYVASAVDAYREATEMYCKGNFDKEYANKLKFKLANIYNRGGFTDGYFFMHNGSNMISTHRPNNQGVCIGKITGIKNGKVDIQLTEDLYSGDVLELESNDSSIIEITSGSQGAKDQTVSLPAPKTRLIKNQTNVYRTRCNEILESINSSIFNTKKYPISLDMNFTGQIGNEAKLIISCDIFGQTMEGYATANIVEEASSDKTCDIERIKSKLVQLGNTDYIDGYIQIDVDNKSFIPDGMVKKLRREAIASLEENITNHFRRNYISVFDNENMSVTKNTQINHIISVNTSEQLRIIDTSCIPDNSIILADRKLLLNYKGNMLTGLRIPRIITSTFDIIDETKDLNLNALYIQNIDGFACVVKNKDYLYEKYSKDLIIIIASSLYTYNSLAIKYILKEFPNAIIEASKELNLKEMNYYKDYNVTFPMYGYQAVMLSAQCLNKTKNNICNHNNDSFSIRDELGNQFHVQCCCDSCYNVIYNGNPYCMYAHKEEVDELVHPSSYSIDFTIEKPEDVAYVIKNNRSNTDKITTGHCYRGVE